MICGFQAKIWSGVTCVSAIAAEPAGDVDDPGLLDVAGLRRAGQRRFQAVGAAPVIDRRPVGRRADQQLPAQCADRMKGIARDREAVVAGAEDRAQLTQQLGHQLDAVVEQDVGRVGLLLDAVGKRYRRRRDHAVADDQIGMQPFHIVGGCRRVESAELADDRQPRIFGRQQCALGARQRRAASRSALPGRARRRTPPRPDPPA